MPKPCQLLGRLSFNNGVTPLYRRLCPCLCNHNASSAAGIGLLLIGYTLLSSSTGSAEEIGADANIVTALDISESIDAKDLRAEIKGLAEAIRSPRVLAAIQSGRMGRVGFAVFAWHHGQFPDIVPWRLIATKQDALLAAQEIEARLDVDVEVEARASVTFYAGRLTDLSQAIDHASRLLHSAPYAADCAIVNVIGNGEDNVGEDASFARDRIVKSGATVNGVVLGGGASVIEYYRQQVARGPGAFVLSIRGSADMVDMLARKFWYDIALAAPAGVRVSSTKAAVQSR